MNNKVNRETSTVESTQSFSYNSPVPTLVLQIADWRSPWEGKTSLTNFSSLSDILQVISSSVPFLSQNKQRMKQSTHLVSKGVSSHFWKWNECGKFGGIAAARYCWGSCTNFLWTLQVFEGRRTFSVSGWIDVNNSHPTSSGRHVAVDLGRAQNKAERCAGQSFWIKAWKRIYN